MTPFFQKDDYAEWAGRPCQLTDTVGERAEVRFLDGSTLWVRRDLLTRPHGVQPDPRAAMLVSLAAEAVERFGDDILEQGLLEREPPDDPWGQHHGRNE